MLKETLHGKTSWLHFSFYPAVWQGLIQWERCSTMAVAMTQQTACVPKDLLPAVQQNIGGIFNERSRAGACGLLDANTFQIVSTPLLYACN